MPDPQNQPRESPEQERQRKIKKNDPYHGFDFTIEGLSGINTTTPPLQIPDDEVVALYNYLPVAKNTVRKIQSPAQVGTIGLPGDPIKVVNDVLIQLGPQLALNPGFETVPSAGSPPSNWTVMGSPQFWSQDQAIPHTGIASAHINDSIPTGGGFNQPIAFVAGIKYRIGFWYRISSGTLKAGTDLYSLSFPADASNTNIWTYGELTFFSAGDTLIQFVNGSNVFGAEFRIDDVTVNTVGTSGNVMMAILDDGALGIIHSNGLFTVVAPANTFSKDPSLIDITNWQNKVYLIVDQNTGYFSFDGTTLLLISPTLNGRSICIWAGRVFIGNGRIINYSVPGGYLDFSAVNGGGYFTVNFTDLKQEIIRLIPYVDSFYIIGDHAIISMTGTTISNNPANWYQMELFNSVGSTFGCNLVNWGNILFLINEYGIWMIASTQNQKLDYEFDMTQVKVNNFQSGIGQVGNLNFYFIPISFYSQVSGTTVNGLLAYCIELKKFYLLDLGFQVGGVFITLSENDHSIYAWGHDQNGSKIYRLFVGSGAIASYIQYKTFDLGDSYVYKQIKDLFLDTWVIKGTPNFTVYCMASWPNLPFQNTMMQQVISNPYPVRYLTDELGNYILDENGNMIIVEGGSVNNYFNDYVFSVAVGGVQFTFVIWEGTNAIFEIVRTKIRGFIGRRIR
jgi:hypothetical protein